MTNRELNDVLSALENEGYDGDVVYDAIKKIELDAGCLITDYEPLEAAIEITRLVNMWRWLEDEKNQEK